MAKSGAQQGQPCLRIEYETEGKIPNISWEAVKGFREAIGASGKETAFKAKIYYDTEDLELYKLGIDLRTQKKPHGLYKHQIKIPVSNPLEDSDLSERIEISWDTSSPVPDLSDITDRMLHLIEDPYIRDTVRDLRERCRNTELRPILGLYTRRRIFSRDHGSDTVEYAHAEGVIVTANETVIPTQVFEAEIKDGQGDPQRLMRHFARAQRELHVSHTTTESVATPGFSEVEFYLNQGNTLPRRRDFWNLARSGGWAEETLRAMSKLMTKNHIRKTGVSFSLKNND